jgi:hypothetical protein
MEQIIIWLMDNIASAIISVCIGTLLGVSGTTYYFKNNKRQSLKTGNNSTNIQVNGNLSSNDINIK